MCRDPWNFYRYWVLVKYPIVKKTGKYLLQDKLREDVHGIERRVRPSLKMNSICFDKKKDQA